MARRGARTGKLKICLTAGCNEDADGACSRCGYRSSDLPAETSTLTDKETPMGSNLAEHARRELTLCRQMDEDPEYAESIVRAVEAFASFGHSGGSAAVAREQLYILLGWGTLSPLTSAPDEWEDRSEESGYPMWQSRRDPAAFSDNGGKTWWHLDEKEAPGEAEPGEAEPVVHRVLPAEEAATHTEPEDGPWRWSAPVMAIVSDSRKWAGMGPPAEWRIAESAIANLYRCGYALVEVACPACPHPMTAHRWPLEWVPTMVRCAEDGCGCVTPRPVEGGGDGE